MTDAPISYDTKAVAALVGLSYDSVSKAIKKGDLVARYYGTKPLITRAEAERWINSLDTEPEHKSS